jgi:hypothetical protein
MDASQPSRRGTGTFSQPGTARHGRRQGRRNAVAALNPGTSTPADRSGARIQAAERNLAEVYRKLRSAGVDRDQLDTEFGVLWDAIAEIKARREQPQRELAPAHHDRDQARRQPPDPVQYSGTPGSVIPDMPGFSLCPDPATVQTPAEFMDCLRRYRIWSGKMSYREMERKCGRRFAASTICTALQGDELPSFDMVLAVVVACGGGEEHQLSFLAAWRSIQLHQDAGQAPARPQRSRALRAVSETA